jgi:hypothetical protein
LPRRSARSGRVPAHIGEALPPMAKGNPEGSPSDPVTTDPKGEAGRIAAERQLDTTCNTPALVKNKAAYGARVSLDPWFVSGLTEGEGCFCVSLALRSKLRTGLEVRPSFSLSLNEKDLELMRDLQTFFGCGWIRGVQHRSHLQVRGAGGRRSPGSDHSALRALPPKGKQGLQLCGVQGRLPDDRARRSSAAGRPAQDHRHRLRDESRKATSGAGRSPKGADEVKG